MKIGYNFKNEQQKSTRPKTAECFDFTGGERGIRTLGRVSPTLDFQSSSFDHSDTSPCERQSLLYWGFAVLTRGRFFIGVGLTGLGFVVIIPVKLYIG